MAGCWSAPPLQRGGCCFCSWFQRRRLRPLGMLAGAFGCGLCCALAACFTLLHGVRWSGWGNRDLTLTRRLHLSGPDAHSQEEPERVSAGSWMRETSVERAAAGGWRQPNPAGPANRKGTPLDSEHPHATARESADSKVERLAHQGPSAQPAAARARWPGAPNGSVSWPAQMVEAWPSSTVLFPVLPRFAAFHLAARRCRTTVERVLEAPPAQGPGFGRRRAGGRIRFGRRLPHDPEPFGGQAGLGSPCSAPLAASPDSPCWSARAWLISRIHTGQPLLAGGGLAAVGRAKSRRSTLPCQHVVGLQGGACPCCCCLEPCLCSAAWARSNDPLAAICCPWLPAGLGPAQRAWPGLH